MIISSCCRFCSSKPISLPCSLELDIAFELSFELWFMHSLWRSPVPGLFAFWSRSSFAESFVAIICITLDTDDDLRLLLPLVLVVVPLLPYTLGISLVNPSISASSSISSSVHIVISLEWAFTCLQLLFCLSLFFFILFFKLSRKSHDLRLPRLFFLSWSFLVSSSSEPVDLFWCFFRLTICLILEIFNIDFVWPIAVADDASGDDPLLAWLLWSFKQSNPYIAAPRFRFCTWCSISFSIWFWLYLWLFWIPWCTITILSLSELSLLQLQLQLQYLQTRHGSTTKKTIAVTIIHVQNKIRFIENPNIVIERLKIESLLLSLL